MSDEAYELTFEDFLEVYDFAFGRESKLDDLEVGCVAVACCLALHQLNADSNLIDLEINKIDNMPIREMPSVAMKLRARLRPAFEKAIAEVNKS